MLDHKATIDSLGWLTITGRARAGRPYRYAQIRFAVYNATGDRVGSAMANVAGLETGQTWQYRAMYTGHGGRRYELSEITGW